MKSKDWLTLEYISQNEKKRLTIIRVVYNIRHVYMS